MRKSLPDNSAIWTLITTRAAEIRKKAARWIRDSDARDDAMHAAAVRVLDGGGLPDLSPADQVDWFVGKMRDAAKAQQRPKETIVDGVDGVVQPVEEDPKNARRRIEAEAESSWVATLAARDAEWGAVQITASAARFPPRPPHAPGAVQMCPGPWAAPRRHNTATPESIALAEHLVGLESGALRGQLPPPDDDARAQEEIRRYRLVKTWKLSMALAACPIARCDFPRELRKFLDETTAQAKEASRAVRTVQRRGAVRRALGPPSKVLEKFDAEGKDLHTAIDQRPWIMRERWLWPDENGGPPVEFLRDACALALERLEFPADEIMATLGLTDRDLRRLREKFAAPPPHWLPYVVSG